ncbi:V-type ATP synthase subunit I [Clostridium saccharobutylicum]|uniref:V-type ATP synthase subunit I n=1 Tax=Clostridium saccharobutylicum TaxID=169679 RepID=A0A1S8MSX4_CLOSA|nr:V-type ATP synthase subunit I [Clostridium saccharobutylicum]OOM07286.1 V-type ATP synthase subunit I [Clostridium saccharobutylicum]
MAIVKMNKFTLLALEDKKDALLRRLQVFSNVEFINLQDENFIENNSIFNDLDKSEVDSQIAKWEEKLLKSKFLIEFLEKYVPKQSLLKSLCKEKISLTMEELEKTVSDSNWEGIYDKVKSKDNKLTELENDKNKFKGYVENLQPYEQFDAPLSSLEELRQTAYYLGSVSNQYEDSLQSALDDCYLEIISKDKQHTYFITLCNKENSKKVENILRGFGFSQFKTEEKNNPLKLIHEYNEKISLIESEQFIIKEELAGYDQELKTMQLVYEYYNNLLSRKMVNNNFLKTKSTILIQGWLPIHENEQLIQIAQEALNDDHYLNFEDVKEEEIDEVPIKLENNDLNSSFEAVTEMYSLPKYNDIDPTPFVAPFYLIFFGMMVADAGYGILMLIGTLLSLKFFHFEEKTNKMVKFFMYLSFPTILFGMIYGSFFGDLIKFKGLIDTTTDVMTILVISVVFGVIQIFFGLGIKATVLIKIGQPLEAFMDVGSWVITLISFGGIAASISFNLSILRIISIIGAVVGSILIVLTQGRQMKTKGGQIAQGFYELYGITSYVSDLVSYTRLMAIGLSGGSIAGAINMIMHMIPGVGRFIAIPLIFLLGQTVNLGLSLLSGYVHTLRLTYVEYFSKFYDGGGRAFKPFKPKNQYINLKRD